jgi:hypothetical protein
VGPCRGTARERKELTGDGPRLTWFRHLHRAPAGQEDRVPPGLYVTDGFPVLSAGPTPHTPLEQWTFSIT